MSLITGSPLTASFFFALNVRSVLSSTGTLSLKLAEASRIPLARITEILDTSFQDKPVSLDEAMRVLVTLRKITGFPAYVTFEDFCKYDLAEAAGYQRLIQQALGDKQHKVV